MFNNLNENHVSYKESIDENCDYTIYLNLEPQFNINGLDFDIATKVCDINEYIQNNIETYPNVNLYLNGDIILCELTDDNNNNSIKTSFQ